MLKHMLEKKSAEDVKSQNEANELRVDIANAYSFIEGQRFTTSIASFTPEDAMDAFIERTEGTSNPLRTNEIARTKNIMAKVEAAVTRIKALPPSAFRRRDDKRDVNSR